jgi:hypothetical protein
MAVRDILTATENRKTSEAVSLRELSRTLVVAAQMASDGIIVMTLSYIS